MFSCLGGPAHSGDDDGHIVMLVRTVDECIGGGDDLHHHLLRGAGFEHLNAAHQVILTPFAIFPVHRLADSVGECHQQVARFEDDRRLLI